MTIQLLHGRRAPRRVVIATAVRSLAGMGLLTLIYFTLPLQGRLGAWPVALLVIALAAFGYLVYVQIRGVMRADYPMARAIQGVSWAVPGFLLIYAAVYYELALHTPKAFSAPMTRLDSLYFTVTTFATVGYGDITPVSSTARTLAIVQMLVDLVTIGLIAKALLQAVRVKLSQDDLGQ